MDYACNMKPSPNSDRAPIDVDRDYFLFLADLRGSRSLKRAAAAEVLAVLSDTDLLVRDYPGEFAVEPQLGRGDEISALFYGPSQIHDFSRRLRTALRPWVQFRFVVERGRVTFPSDTMSQLGGQVFAYANERLEELKSQRRYCSIHIGGYPGDDEVLTHLAELENRLVESMTDYQRDIYEVWRSDSEDDMTLARVATQLGKSISSVHRAREAGGVLPAWRAAEALDRKLYALTETEQKHA